MKGVIQQNRDVVKQTENKNSFCVNSLVTDRVKPKTWSGVNGEGHKSHLPVKLRREL